ncbi:MAG: sugar ABC transporter permease [Clostridia bacterium]|nr:sugar ABC transporter permease [Clostridia bacterium]
MKRNRYRYLLILPGFLFFFIFKYIPYSGLLIAFQDYNVKEGIFGSKFIGLENFRYLMQTPDFLRMIRNTLTISILSIVFYFPLPIVISVLLSEVRHDRYKKVMQSVVYLPHFLSWVVVYALTFFLLSIDVGVVNKIFMALGLEKVSFLTNKTAFYVIITAQTVWRETGWGTILFLAAICGINMELYEAAAIDGANRLQQIWHISLPGIKTTIITLLILRLGRMADVSLEQVLLIQNPVIKKVSEVFSTYAYNFGILKGLTSIGVAVDMFKSVINVVFVFTANYIVKKMGEESIL